MNKNKLVLSYCPNFYKIINFDYLKDDLISEKLVTVYEDYIFNINVEDSNELQKVKELDAALSIYIDDYNFRKEMKYHLKEIEIEDQSTLQIIVASVLKIFENYKEGITTAIYLSRWI